MKRSLTFEADKPGNGTSSIASGGGRLRWEEQADRPDADASGTAFAAIAELAEPVLVLRLPAERIVHANHAARELLGGPDPVGRCLSDLLDTPELQAPELVARGHLTGYQALRRRLGAPAASPVELWVHAVTERDPAAPVLAMISVDGGARRWAGQDVGDEAAMVVGSADRQLAVDRIGDGTEAFLGQPPEDVLGRSLTGLVSPEDLPRLLFALGQATAARHGVSLTVRLIRPDHSRMPCQLVLVPLNPPPSVAFALQPARELLGSHRSAGELRQVLRRFGRALVAASNARQASSHHTGLRPALPELTSRELQIVNRLLAGDRVPAISQQLYLAQSTVRNHLSAVFAKLGVKSQQELIVLLRRAQSRQG